MIFIVPPKYNPYMQCVSCGATILESTLQRCGGLCKACWKDNLQKKIGKTPFGVAYDTFFSMPRRLAGNYFDFWMDLEFTIAGPLFTARQGGDVRYVFRKKAIKGVETFEDLMAWMKAHIARFHDRVRDSNATIPAEVRSRDELLSRVTGLTTLIELWPDFDAEFGRPGTANSPRTDQSDK